MPAVCFLVSFTISGGSRHTPPNASMLPYTSQSFSLLARFAMPLMTAFSPGQSPPPVNTNTLCVFSMNDLRFPVGGIDPPALYMNKLVFGNEFFLQCLL